MKNIPGGIQDFAPDVSIEIMAYTVGPTDPSGPLYFTIKALGVDRARVLERTQQVFDWLTAGRKTFVRAPVGVEGVADFVADYRGFRGYARFSVYNESGEHKTVDTAAGMLGMRKPA